MSPAGTAGGTAVVLSRLGAEVLVVRRRRHRPDRRRRCSALLAARGRRRRRAGPQGRPPDLVVGDPGPAERRPAGLALHRRQRRVHPRRPRLRRSTGSTHLHLGGPEFLGGEAAGQLLAHGPRRSGRRPRSTSSRRATRTCSAWIADALPHTDYLLPNDEQVLGFTGAASLAEGARALVAARRRLRRRDPGRARARWSSTADEVIEVPAYADRGRRHHRLRRRVLGRLPARARRSAATCARRPGSAAPPRPRSRRGSAPTPAPTRWTSVQAFASGDPQSTR